MKTLIVVSSLIMVVLVGGILVNILQKTKNDQIIKLLLAFSGGFLLTIGFVHFIPELYIESSVQVGLFILLGFLIQIVLEIFSGGIEHGHVHHHHEVSIPIGLILALSLHSFIEGIPMGSIVTGHEVSTMHAHENDYSLLLGVLFHRLPVAIALMTLLISSKIKLRKAWMILGIFALTAPAGVLFGIYSQDYLTNFNFDIILAIVVGMFLHISTTIIFETSENHKFNFVKLMTIVTGSFLAFIIH